MTIAELVDLIAKASKSADASSLRKHLGDLNTLTRQGRPIGDRDAARLVEALHEGVAIDHAVGGGGHSELEKLVDDIAKHARDSLKSPGAAAAIRRTWPRIYGRLGRHDKPVQPQTASELLDALRKARVFDLLSLAADRLASRGLELDGKTRTLYAQGLIDTGQIYAGIALLRPMLTDPAVCPAELSEVQGLLSRATKQIYVNNVPRAKSAMDLRGQYKDYLMQSIGYARSAYDAKRPADTAWHGVQLIGLARLAREDGIPVPDGIDEHELARNLIEALEPHVASWPNPYAASTVAQAYLALGNTRKAAEYFGKFLEHEKIDAFMISGTLRQLQEVWRISAGPDSAGQIVAGLKLALAGKGHSRLVLTGEERQLLASSGNPEQDAKAYKETFETMTKGGKFLQLALLQTIVARANGVARIRTPAMLAHGTGFIVDGPSLSPKLAPGIYLLTNAHVISTNADEIASGALRPEKAQIIFEAEAFAGITKVYQCDPVPEWESPSSMHDATLLRLTTDARHLPRLPIANQDKRIVADQGDNSTKVAILGHPEDEPLSLSTTGSIVDEQGHIVDLGPRKKDDKDPIYLHYVTPTKGGNSGSPVFDTEKWEVIGLHHAGFPPDKGRPKLAGKSGSNFANEGIHINSIRRAIGDRKKR
jgi:V8-like Glu-specific endopeptidase